MLKPHVSQNDEVGQREVLLRPGRWAQSHMEEILWLQQCTCTRAGPHGSDIEFDSERS